MGLLDILKIKPPQPPPEPHTPITIYIRSIPNANRSAHITITLATTTGTTISFVSNQIRDQLFLPHATFNLMFTHALQDSNETFSTLDALSVAVGISPGTVTTHLREGSKTLAEYGIGEGAALHVEKFATKGYRPARRVVKIVDVMGEDLVDYHLTKDRDVWVYEVLWQLVGEEWPQFKLVNVAPHEGKGNRKGKGKQKKGARRDDKILDAKDILADTTCSVQNGAYVCRVEPQEGLDQNGKIDDAGWPSSEKGGKEHIDRPNIIGKGPAFVRVVSCRDGRNLDPRPKDRGELGEDSDAPMSYKKAVGEGMMVQKEGFRTAAVSRVEEEGDELPPYEA